MAVGFGAGDNVRAVAAMDLDALRRLLKDVDAPYEVDDLDESGVRLRLPADLAHIRPGGTISGPALMTLADATAWAALLARIGPVVSAVSTSLHIDFLRRPPPGDVVAEGRILRLGRSLAVMDVSMRLLGDDEPVAAARVTYAIPAERRGPQ